MFPYKGFLKIITKQNSYTEKEIAMIQVVSGFSLFLFLFT